MIDLFQERTAWGNGSCKTLSLLFPMINDHERLKPPWLIRSTSQSSNFVSCLSRWGEGLEFLGNASRWSEGQSFEEIATSLLCHQGRYLVILRWTFMWDPSSQMEQDLHFSPIGQPFHSGIPKTQTLPNQGKTKMRSCFPWRIVWLPCLHRWHWGPTRSPWWIQSKESNSRIWISLILVVHY
jgi:hypothetical protein